MDQFLDSFDVTGDEANALRLLRAVSPEMTCSHLRRDCLIGGICAKQFFNEVLMAILDSKDRQAARQLVTLAVMTSYDRELIWLNVLRSTEVLPANDYAHEIQNVVLNLKRVFIESGLEEKYKSFRAKRRPNRSPTEDAFSFLPFFYIPMNETKRVGIKKLTRVRNLGVAFVDRREVTHHLPFTVDAARRDLMMLRNFTLEHQRTCTFTGSKSLIHGMIFCPEEMEPLFQKKETALEIYRICEQDMKFINSRGTMSFPRFLMQRLAVKNASSDAMDQVMLGRTPSDGRLMSVTGASFFFGGGPDWRKWAMPALLVRAARLRTVVTSFVKEWFDSTHTCQVCFLVEKGVADSIPITDVRLSDVCGVGPVAYVRSYAHDDGNAPDVRVLRKGEIFRLMGGHYVMQTTASTMESLVVAAKEMQRLVRGDGFWDTPYWGLSMANLCKIMFHENPAKEQIHFMIKLITFGMFGGVQRHNGLFTDWDNLEEFLKRMFSTEEMGVRMYESSYHAILRACILHLQTTAKPTLVQLTHAIESLDLGIEEVPFNFYV
ncbi:NS1 [Orungo virus]|uniref:Non-structural protein NS1 n=1 Tax=Orungo virus TaxID=40058 RepID=W5QM01_9REOV|nr:NS1 [Orungo virus]AFX73391.1 NS1 [Orungo virus]